MSWFKSLSFSGGDVFDESGDELSLQSREWISNMKKRVRDGYVDGVDAGEEASLQLGFDMGFSEGAAQTAAVGRLKGIVSAIGCWCQFQHPENPVPASVCDLLQQVSQHEDAIMEGIKRALENPPPSVSDVSESMEELEVDQADQGCCGGGGGGCKEEDCCKGGGGGGEKMEEDVPQRPQKLRSRSSAGSSSSGENFELLLQRCVDLVTELGLPQELIGHIRELKNM
ncbi:LOW QUALITY PROTEIN: OTU deubiquitinase with linear linkage specificity a [Scomber japonicus]|uniref:LOW QUALITY PROTEIN: OTU deubiquitinase with linear linkage specificity a n=1 Tax=Scomber japonicus TaxID=13676 RepID=UPI002306D73C|nr:LOW QUALITY PROTEIN: OTU deubiquitinase with linear linkage specificity a [Scomber japonicus]